MPRIPLKHLLGSRDLTGYSHFHITVEDAVGHTSTSAITTLFTDDPMLSSYLVSFCFTYYNFSPLVALVEIWNVS